MRAASEIDPLLPNNASAPEISSHGRSRSKIEAVPAQAPQDYEEEEEERWEENISDRSARSTLSTLAVLFGLIVFFAFVVGVLCPAGIDDKWPFNRSRPARTIEERVIDVLEGTPLIDGHNDLAITIRLLYGDKIQGDDFKKKFETGGMKYQVDLPRLKAGQVGGAFWSAFVVCPENASDDFSDATYSSAVSHTLQQIDLIRRIQAAYPQNFTSALVPLSTALNNFHLHKTLISPISIEGLHQVPQSAPLSTLRLYYSLGVRAATLTWNCHNAFADAAVISSGSKDKPAPYHRGGLTSAGRKVIREMNRLGMLIDISHTSYWTQKAVLSDKTSAAPVIYSHSSAFALCPHPRNVHDDILELVKETKSLVMVNFSPGFISCLPPLNSSVLPVLYEQNNTLHQAARHIVYIGERIGYDYVGLGSDFDGMGSLTPKGLDGVDKYPDLVAELLRMGVKDKDASKIVGGNLLRVWQTAEGIAKGMQNSGVLEGEDDVEGY